MPKPKLLVAELWGIGDLVMATGFLAAARARFQVTLLGKPHARALLEPMFPDLHFISWDAPWTVFSGKYRLSRWDWRALGGVLRTLRRERFDVALSARLGDPRDHLLLRLAGIPRRLGFPHRRARALLTDPLPAAANGRHIVEDWRALAQALELNAPLEPRLDATRYPDPPARETSRPSICLHTGARIPVRRWPEEKFADIIHRLRARFDFELVLIPDPDGYGLGLATLADRVIPKLSLPELVGVLAASDVLVCNDSAPGHLAAACGTPVVTFFGPTDPVRYRPWGDGVHVVIRDICPFRPCFDYCRFPEPHCLTRLDPQDTWPEVEAFLAPRLRSS